MTIYRIKWSPSPARRMLRVSWDNISYDTVKDSLDKLYKFGTATAGHEHKSFFNI